MRPWEMVLAHKYDEAMECYEARLKENPEDEGSLDGYATVLLCTERYEKALAMLERASALTDPRLRGESQPYLKRIGAVLWLSGRRHDAIRTFRTATDGILNGSIKFADNAGGVSQGMLLWYAGVTARDTETVKHAERYLRRLSKKSRIQYWPGPVAVFVLGEKTFGDLLLAATGSSDLEGATVKASSDLLVRRQLVVALFYSATKARSEGREDTCNAWMTACAQLENPILEPEWFLARAEVKVS